MSVKCEVCGHLFADRDRLDDHIATDHATGLGEWGA